MFNHSVVSSRLAVAWSASITAIKCPLTRSTSRPASRRQLAAHQLRPISHLGSSTLSMSGFLSSNCSSLSATCLLLLVSILIPVPLVSAEASAAPTTTGNRLGQDPATDLAGGLSALLGGSLDEKLIGGAGEPRQYFKLRVIPSPSNSARKKKAHARAIANKSEHKQKITNAALRKLLNQSLLKAANSSSSSIFNNNSISGSPGSNFRLVFVQRAPVTSDSPSSTTSKPSIETTDKDADSSNLLNGRKLSPPSSSSGSSKSNVDSGNGSSLSKQLAETLISSTLNMAFNSPSISSLASKLAVKGFETMLANRNSSTVSDLVDGKVSNSVKREHAPLSTSINSKTRKPSKVYNLPIKFVADGQPYHITVFSALKKHLLASAGSTTGSGMKKSHHKTHHPVAAASLKVSKNFDEHGRHRKLEHSQKKKETHGNSRLIYLPLKYFNNGRISKVIINNSSGSYSSSSSSSVSPKRKGR